MAECTDWGSGRGTRLARISLVGKPLLRSCLALRAAFVTGLVMLLFVGMST